MDGAGEADAATSGAAGPATASRSAPVAPVAPAAPAAPAALAALAAPASVAPDLVRRAQGGDALAMNELLDGLAPYVRRLCGPIALQDSADAAQEALIVVFQNLRGLREPAALFGWVRTIAVREALRVARRSARIRPAELPDVPAPGSAELAADIRDVLARLSPEHRAILMLREVEGLDEKSAGELLRIAPGTAKSRLSRAKSMFRKAWDA